MGQYNEGQRDKLTGHGDPYLELTLLILRGIPPIRREDWMRRNMPLTYSLLGAARLFDVGSRQSRSHTLREAATGSMQHPQRGAYL